MVEEMNMRISRICENELRINKFKLILSGAVSKVEKGVVIYKI